MKSIKTILLSFIVMTTIGLTSCSHEVEMADHLLYLEAKRDNEFAHLIDIAEGQELEHRFDMLLEVPDKKTLHKTIDWANESRQEGINRFIYKKEGIYFFTSGLQVENRTYKYRAFTFKNSSKFKKMIAYLNSVKQ